MILGVAVGVLLKDGARLFEVAEGHGRGGMQGRQRELFAGLQRPQRP